MKTYLIIIFSIFSYVSIAQESYEELYNKGYEATKEGNFEKAIEYFSKCILKNRKDQAAYWSRGYAYLEQSMMPEALDDINKAIDLTPSKDLEDFSKLYSIRGNIYYKSENYKDAISDYSKAISYDSKSLENYWYRAICYQYEKDFEKALHDFKYCENLFEKDDLDNLSLLYNSIANTYESLDNNQDAIEFYNKSIKTKPNNNIAYLYRGIIHFDQNDYDKAINDLTEALSSYKTDNEIKAEIYLYRGRSYMEIGEYEKSLEDLSISIKEKPDFFSYQIRGDLKRLMGNYKDAIEDFNKSIELEPKNDWAYYRRGWTKEFDNDNNSAIKDYDRAIELDPQYAYTYLSRGRLKAKLFGFEKAKSDYEKVISIETEYREGGNSKQYALYYLGRNQEAIDWVLKIIEKYPNSGNYYDMACLYSIMNKKNDAIKYLDIALEKGYKDFIHMANDDDLNNVKFSEEFKNMLLKYKINVEIPIPISDVDILIPELKLDFKNRFALVIGNEDYSSYQIDLEKEVNVDFARNDAFAFKEYLIKVLGVPEKNITTLTNATAAQILQGLEKLSKLASITQGKSELFFYYAGHGFANQETKESFLMPVDVNTNNLQYAIKLQVIYDKLAEFPTQKTIIFLDACFSGGARNKELSTLRGVKVKPKQNSLKGNLLVFASSSDIESSQSFTQKKHGLFTYYFLKKIQESRGNLTYKDLFDYVKENVSLESILNKNQSQTPTLLVSPDIEKSWSVWKIN